ncbi:hypothetical protein [Luteimonas fraxinea]|uniref:hypothetical protein n=1 Tax=Luteimonas fraxinea TaxID=2901869 RepID=UPI001E283140|nr:hypothetical protein [Luteimonas fraxinea]MCD9125859.1 hypothetical protein [Luteimonas fraxinea]
MNFSTIFSGLSIVGAVFAIIGAGVILASPDFTRWLTNKVATFFDGEQADDAVRSAGEVDEDHEYECFDCGYTMDSDAAVYALDAGHCPKCGGEC